MFESWERVDVRQRRQYSVIKLEEGDGEADEEGDSRDGEERTARM